MDKVTDRRLTCEVKREEWRCFSVAICVVAVAHDLSKMAAGMYHPEETMDRNELTDHLNMAACLCNCTPSRLDENKKALKPVCLQWLSQ